MRRIKLIIPVFLCSIFLLKGFIFAQETALDLITATVKISICGNGTIEGGEDCEGNSLGGTTCKSLGYSEGNLTCDIACSFDTSNCLPTTTPTPQPTPTNTPTSAPAATNTPVSTATSTPAPATATPAPTPIIPSTVAVFDIDNSGRIEVEEVLSTVRSWVEEWKEAIKEEAETTLSQRPKKCDLNRDRYCNLVDLSILLYYIGR